MGGPRFSPRLAQAFFMLLVGAGVLAFLVGEYISTRPYLQLDVVLTQEELKDHELRDATLERLKLENEGKEQPWCVGGGLAMVVGYAGLLLLMKYPAKESASGNRKDAGEMIEQPTDIEPEGD